MDTQNTHPNPLPPISAIEAAERILELYSTAATLPVGVDCAIDAYMVALWSERPAHPVIVLATVAAAPAPARARVARALGEATAATLAHVAALREGGTVDTTATVALEDETAHERLRGAIAAALEVVRA